MRVEIICQGRKLRQHHHQGEQYIEVPVGGGDYEIVLTNTNPFLALSRRMVVVSVDGINIIDGKNAGYDGPGYVLGPNETARIKGWMRTNSKVAAFSFDSTSESYANKTGRGVENVGVIGVAVFDELTFAINYGNSYYTTWPQPQPPFNPSWPQPESPFKWTTGCNSPPKGITRSVTSTNSVIQNSLGCSTVSDVGTAYGQETTMFTGTTRFQRSSSIPAQVLTLRYATREKLEEWGVVVSRAPVADPFPCEAITASCPAPPGWGGK